LTLIASIDALEVNLYATIKGELVGWALMNLWHYLR
jgi:hypothetical protein